MRNHDQALVADHRLVLAADSAADLMSAKLVSLRHDASVCEAIALLIDRNIDAAPVIDDNGRPIGVVTVTDIMVHDREYARQQSPNPSTVDHVATLDVKAIDRTAVGEIMTPSVFTVDVGSPAADVVRKMLDRKVHHLFVADDDGVLIGVISTCDILRRLG